MLEKGVILLKSRTLFLLGLAIIATAVFIWLIQDFIKVLFLASVLAGLLYQRIVTALSDLQGFRVWLSGLHQWLYHLSFQVSEQH